MNDMLGRLTNLFFVTVFLSIFLWGCGSLEVLTPSSGTITTSSATLDVQIQYKGCGEVKTEEFKAWIDNEQATDLFQYQGGEEWLAEQVQFTKGKHIIKAEVPVTRPEPWSLCAQAKGNASVEFTIKRPLDSITITPNMADVDIRETINLTATVRDTDNDDVTPEVNIYWNSENNGIAEITKSYQDQAEVLGRRIGTTSINARSDSVVSSSAIINVKPILRDVGLFSEARLTASSVGDSQISANGNYNLEIIDTSDTSANPYGALYTDLLDGSVQPQIVTFDRSTNQSKVWGGAGFNRCSNLGIVLSYADGANFKFSFIDLKDDDDITHPGDQFFFRVSFDVDANLNPKIYFSPDCTLLMIVHSTEGAGSNKDMHLEVFDILENRTIGKLDFFFFKEDAPGLKAEVTSDQKVRISSNPTPTWKDEEEDIYY